MNKTVSVYHRDAAIIETLLPSFQRVLPKHPVVAWRSGRPSRYLIAWQPEDALFHTPQLDVIFALGAGVDAFLEHVGLPSHVKMVRLQEAGMGAQMLEIVLYAIVHHSRDMITLNRAQRDRRWLVRSMPKRSPFTTKVGVLGLGQLGRFVATRLSAIGYPVSGYSRQLKDIAHVNCFAGDKGLCEFLSHSEVLINLLPLTAYTEGFLNRRLFARLPRGAYLINIGRGRHLVEQDLIPAIDSGQLDGAFLDVFKEEPLPEVHPFWGDDRIIITPHLAAMTLPEEAIAQITQNILAHECGEPMTGLVDRAIGY